MHRPSAKLKVVDILTSRPSCPGLDSHYYLNFVLIKNDEKIRDA